MVYSPALFVQITVAYTLMPWTSTPERSGVVPLELVETV